MARVDDPTAPLPERLAALIARVEELEVRMSIVAPTVEERERRGHKPERAPREPRQRTTDNTEETRPDKPERNPGLVRGDIEETHPDKPPRREPVR